MWVRISTEVGRCLTYPVTVKKLGAITTAARQSISAL